MTAPISTPEQLEAKARKMIVRANVARAMRDEGASDLTIGKALHISTQNVYSTIHNTSVHRMRVWEFETR